MTAPWPDAGETTVVTRARARAIHKRLGNRWTEPEPFGPDGAQFHAVGGRERGTIMVTSFSWANTDGGTDLWLHAAIARERRAPMHSEVAMLHRAVFEGGWAYQMWSADVRALSSLDHSVHLWGTVSGEMAMPNFGDELGMI